MKEPVWVLREVVLMAHEQSLAQFGGSAGVRDSGLMDSALGKPQNLHAYGKPDLFDLAASYAFGLVKNHPFIDGNKRAAFLAIGLFLHLNGQRLRASQVDAIQTILALAAGHLSEGQLADWIRANLAP